MRQQAGLLGTLTSIRFEKFSILFKNIFKNNGEINLDKNLI
jgi:hypothetical protein